ncbi:PR-1-like protein, partial [Marasmius fiardii PR-910]
PSQSSGHNHHGRGTNDATYYSEKTSGTDQAKYLALHNNFRAQYGSSPLQWNNTLQTAAQKWADGCVFEHSRGVLGHFGENLSAGTGDLGIEGAIKMWTDEADEYDPNYPQYSHFTQMVWKSTTQLGCAVAHGCNEIFKGYGPADLYVCEYYPPGNVIGHFK